MRKLILFILLLAVQSAVKGQAGYELHYWFDNDKKQTISADSNTGEYCLDVSHLEKGLHCLHLQVKDSLERLSAPVTRYFFRMPPTNQEMTFMHWFDNFYEEMTRTTSLLNRFNDNIDVSTIDDGIHQINILVRDGYERFSSPETRHFFKMPITDNDVRLLYWFNEDSTVIETEAGANKMFWIDVSGLNDGFHTLNIQAKQKTHSTTVAHNFIKIPQTENVEELTCLVFVDDSLYCSEAVKSPVGGILNLNIDVSRMNQGVHMLNAYVITPSGAASTTSHHIFIRSTTDEEIAGLKCYYTVDNGGNYMQAGSYNNGAYHFDLDVASLDDGIHQLNYMLVGSNGVSTEARSSFFLKTPVGGNGIMQYEYWINDNDSVKTVKKLEERTDPLKVITLLPVESVPVRSSQFHFEVKDSKPMLYAKNTLNMRFYDISARHTNLSREYIDYQVSQEITDVTPISRDEKSKTFEAPGKNEIKWFSIEAQEGDTLAFRSSQATSLQLFSPTGKEIFTTNGAESTQMDGCHTWENGTHYIAIHDVTGTNQEMTLNILHMDKYDIVDQDIRVVGDAGASTVTYRGNGLKALCEVRFINSQNDTIVAEYIERTSDAEVGIIADFNMAAQGEYDAMFIFSGDEYKIVKNSVTVEEATEINLKTEVKFNSSFLRSSGKNTYDVEVKNCGNMTSYATPVYIYASSKSKHGISKIDIEGLDLPGVFAGVDKDSIPEADREWLEEMEREIADNHYFIDGKTVEKNSTDSIYTKTAYFFVDFAPNSTKKFTVTVYSDETIDVWITVPQTNSPTSNKPVAYMAKSGSRSLKDGYCCIRERVECIATLVADGIGIASKIVELTGAPQTVALGAADCVASSVNTIISSAGTVMCGEGDVEKNFWDKVKSVVNGTSITGMITSCASKVLPWDNFNKLLEAIGDVSGNTSMVFGLGIDQAECIIAFTEKKPNCPPNPGGGGGKSEPVNSFDPNDIVGFTAESGSKHVPNDFENTYYTIRCENDPEFATASAHTVVVCDTLDGSKLNLSTFAARSVKIGDKVMELNGEKSFVKTLDLRTEIDVIAEVTLDYNEQSGIAQWTIKSLDPMTMEPTDDPMQGVLPINNSGNGEAEFCFDIELKPGLAHGEKIDNVASIVFDSENAIRTPVWTNIIDNSRPVSAITGIEEVSDSTILVNWEGSDEGSGIYRYQLYVQAGENEEWKPLLGDTLRTSCKLRYSRDVNFGFCVLATDSAGNVEAKEMTREFEFSRSFIPGDADKSGNVDILDINATLNHILGNESTECDMMQMDSNSDGKIDLLDINTTLDIILNGSAANSNYRRRTNVIRIVNRPTL